MAADTGPTSQAEWHLSGRRGAVASSLLSRRFRKLGGGQPVDLGQVLLDALEGREAAP